MINPANAPRGTDNGGAYGFVRDGYNRAETHDLTTSDVESAKVYDRNDETIGSISSLKVGTDGKITDIRVHLDTTKDRLKAMPHHAAGHQAA